VTVIFFALTAATGISIWQRYPPSINFLLYGLMFSFAVILFYKPIEKLKALNTTFIFLGVNALAYYFYHIVFLVGLDRILDIQDLSEIAVVSLYILTLFTCTIVILIVQRAQKNISEPH
jgi:hypothetical protein